MTAEMFLSSMYFYSEAWVMVIVEEDGIGEPNHRHWNFRLWKKAKTISSYLTPAKMNRRIGLI